MKAREGDLVETIDSNIFDVKGLVHPKERIIAFIRFTPDLNGDREKKGMTYRKVYPLQERYELLRQKFPQYLVYDQVFNEWLCEVSVEAIKHHYQPINYLRKLHQKRQLSQFEKATLLFTELLKKKAKVLRNALGVSGSLLVGLNMPKSDIDIIVYGSQNCYKVYEFLNK